MPVTSYSLTAANNNGTPPAGAPEGMSPADVNDVIRTLMADTALESQKNQVKVLGSVSGTNTITASMSPALASYTAGMFVVLIPAGNNTGATTLNINSLGALDVQKADGDALVSGDLVTGIPALLMLDTGADDWILVNPQTVSATGLAITGDVTINGALTTDNTTADEVGFNGYPANNQGASNYTLVLSDAGKFIQTTGSTTITIPANASVAFPIGTKIKIGVGATGSATIAITSDTLYRAGTGATGSRTVSTFGLVTLMKWTATEWYIEGTGIT